MAVLSEKGLYSVDSLGGALNGGEGFGEGGGKFIRPGLRCAFQKSLGKKKGRYGDKGDQNGGSINGGDGERGVERGSPFWRWGGSRGSF